MLIFYALLFNMYEPKPIHILLLFPWVAHKLADTIIPLVLSSCGELCSSNVSYHVEFMENTRTFPWSNSNQTLVVRIPFKPSTTLPHGNFRRGLDVLQATGLQQRSLLVNRSQPDTRDRSSWFNHLFSTRRRFSTQEILHRGRRRLPFQITKQCDLNHYKYWGRTSSVRSST